MTKKNDGFTIRAYGFCFRPTFWATLWAIPVALFIFGLGTWQMERLVWKNEIISLRTSRVTAVPIALPGETGDMEELEFTPVQVRGVFHHDKELYLGARSMRGNPGYHVVTPLELESGGFILIDRGWIPLTRKDPASRAQAQMEGVVDLSGILRSPGRKGRFQPDNVPADNFWFYFDIPAMAERAGLSDVRPFYLDADGTVNPGGYPLGGQTRINIPNNHLSYAITWYLLALGFIIVYVIFHTKREEDQSDDVA